MKRFDIIVWFALLFALLTQSALCAPITLQKAEQYAAEHLQSLSPLRGRVLQLLYTSSGLPTRSSNEGKDYYVFGSRGGQGYVVVAGDDLLPTILGYSPTETFVPQALPIQLQSYLEGYSQWLQRARAHNLPMGEDVLRDETSVVLPLLKGLAWNQDAPYNGLTPLREGVHAPTGCVATAVAQIMRYFAWPPKARGTIAELPDFGKREYDWQHLPNSCLGASQEVQDAVALLMRDVGFASGMVYKASASGTNSYNAYQALLQHFDYAPSLKYIKQHHYSYNAWQRLILEELKAKRPVYYAGSSSPQANGGHAFVCDGYDGKGYFHFNWGWGGKGNGYFLLYDLTPSALGIGGGSTGGYHYHAEAIVGFEPSVTYKGCEPTTNYVCEGMAVAPEMLGESTKNEKFLCAPSNLQNLGDIPILTATAVAITNTDGKVVLRSYTTETPRELSGDNVIGCEYVALDVSALPDGVYTLRPLAYRSQTEQYEEVRVRMLSQQVVMLEIRGDKKIVTKTTGHPQLEVHWQTNELYNNNYNRVVFSVRNVGNGAYNSRLQAAYGKSEIVPNITRVKDLFFDDFVVLAPGEERQYRLNVKGPFSDEEQYIHFLYDAKNQWNTLGAICPDPLSHTQITNKPSYTLGDVQIDILAKSDRIKSGEKAYCKFRATAETNKGVYLNLRTYIRYNGRAENDAYTPIILYPSESREFVIEKDVALPVGTYKMAAYNAHQPIAALQIDVFVEGEAAALSVPDYTTPTVRDTYRLLQTLVKANGSVQLICQGKSVDAGDFIPKNENITLVASPDEGWELLPANIQITPATVVGIDQWLPSDDFSIKVAFTKKKNEEPQPPNTYKLLLIEQEGEGTVRVLCESHIVEQGEAIEQGKKIRVIATPNTDWEFCDGNITVTPAQKGEGVAEWLPQDNFSVKVVFTKKEQPPQPPIKPDETYQFLGLNITGKGTVQVFCNGEEVKPQERIKRGEKINITVTPAQGWEALPANLRVTASDKIADYEWKPKGDFVIGMLFMQKPPTPQPPVPNPPAPKPPTNVNEKEELGVVIAPNPFAEQLRILSNGLGEGCYELLNALGVVVRVGALYNGETIIATAELKSGLYFLRIKSAAMDAVKTYRLVKQ